MKAKISIIGAGAVGAQAAFCIASKELGDIVLIDILGDMAKGKALDIAQSLPLFKSNVSVVGGDDYTLTKNSDIVVIVAGIPRKPGMTREQLLETNAKIISDVTKKVVRHSPHSLLIVVTNPLDAMVTVAKNVSGFPRERVIGMAGVLDSSRFRYFLAKEADVPVEKVEALVLGSHGEAMVPMERLARVNGKPAVEVVGKEKLKEITERVKNGGAEIIGLLKNVSTSYAPAAAIAEMAESILHDQKKVLPCSVFLEGEYGVKGCAVGVPIILGKSGAEKIVDVDMTEKERKMFKEAVDSIKEMIAHAKKITE